MAIVYSEKCCRAKELQSDLNNADGWIIYCRGVLQIIKLIHSCRHHLERIKESHYIFKTQLRETAWVVNHSWWMVHGLTSGCLRRRWRFMEALVDTLVPQRWHDCASTFSWVRWMCFCSMYSVRYFLSQVAHVHVFPTAVSEREAQPVQQTVNLLVFYSGCIV